MSERTDQETGELQTGFLCSTGYQPDPLESAIESTVRMCAETEGHIHMRLTGHLEALLAAQLARVTP